MSEYGRVLEQRDGYLYDCLLYTSSGTETTINVTATIKIFRMCEIKSMTGIPDEDSKTFVSSAMKVMAAIA